MTVTESVKGKVAPQGELFSTRRLSSAQVVLLIIAISFLIRMVLANAVGLGIDESYMVGISRKFDWSYFDHPPLHVWLVGSWASVFGETPGAVRFPFIVLFTAATWPMFSVTASAYGERAGVWAVIAFTLAPVFTLSTASWVLPDGPLVFFLLLAAMLVRLALQAEDQRAAWCWWLCAGGAGGLAMLSKYLAIFFFVGVGLYLLTSRTHRFWLARPQPWSGIAVALLLFAPVVIWNAEHDYASFAFQGQRGLPETFNVNWLFQGIGGQLLYLLPWIAVALVIAIMRATSRAQPVDQFFLWLAVPAIALFVVLAFVTRILPHWPMAGWLFAFPLLGRDLAALSPAQNRILKNATIGTVVLLLGFCIAASTQARYGWADRHFAHKKDPTVDLYDWHELTTLIAERNLVPDDGFVATGQWIEAGKINYALGDKFSVLCLCDDPRGFAFLHDDEDYAGANALILSRHPDRIAAIGRYFNSVEMLPDIVLTRAGSPVITLKAALGMHLKAEP